MKAVQLIFSSLVLAFSLGALADDGPSQVAVSFNKIYAPKGFDSNDNVQIVGEGLFSNACYRHAPTKFKVDMEKKTIELWPVAYRFNGLCLQVILPFQRVIDLGAMKPGKYKITQQTGEDLGSITIRQAKTDSPDDFIYAPISQAFFQSKFFSNKVYLIGDFPMSCMKMKEVKWSVQKDVLVIQPIAEIDHSVPCVDGKYTYERVEDLGSIAAGRYLLHVRSMNGQSVNNLVDVQ